MSDMDEKLSAPAAHRTGRAQAKLEQIRNMWGRLDVLATDAKGNPTRVRRMAPVLEGEDRAEYWRYAYGAGKDRVFEKEED